MLHVYPVQDVTAALSIPFTRNGVELFFIYPQVPPAQNGQGLAMNSKIQNTSSLVIDFNGAEIERMQSNNFSRCIERSFKKLWEDFIWGGAQGGLDPSQSAQNSRRRRGNESNFPPSRNQNFCFFFIV